ncbi:M20 family metallopeptidase [Kribbella sp. NPDC049227]|uniref:M20 family metallopeptidase n=1 Tax=Kribbella sp. NPDC049227 TaxID=3364113 RepID=UPI003721882E
MTLLHDEAGQEVPRRIRARLERRTDQMALLLGQLVRIESGSDDPAGLNKLAILLAGLFGEFGPVEWHDAGDEGTSHLVLTVQGDDPSAEHIAVLGHYDTVWPAGTLERMPAAVANGALSGPGSFDMKGGLVQLYYALNELRALDSRPRRPLRILFSCDEEVRSRTSRPLITGLAQHAAAALVLESPLPGGALKTSRKGTGTYHLAIEGRAAHAGIEPDKGVSAVLELAHQIQVLHELNHAERGTTVNVGVVNGGTRPNVVPARAAAQVDVRVTTAPEAERVDEAIQRLQPVVPGARLTVTPDLRRPPMEPTDASRALFARAQAVAAAVGMPGLGEGATGGASDANLISALGVPTLDGLGPEGAGAHADHEHVLIESMPRRTALLAGLLMEL